MTQKKPDDLKQLQGTYRKDRVRPRLKISFPPLENLEPPDDLVGNAREAWKQLVPVIKKSCNLTVVDVPLLCVLCWNYAMMLEAGAHLASEGLLVKGSRGMVKSPWLAIERQSSAATLKLMKEFGMTPGSRLHIWADPPAEPSLADELAAMANSDAAAHPPLETSEKGGDK